MELFAAIRRDARVEECAPTGFDPPRGHPDNGTTADLDLLDAHLAGGRIRRAACPAIPSRIPAARVNRPPRTIVGRER